MGFIYQTTATNLSVTDTGDFVQLRNSSTLSVVIHEVRVWQESDTTLAMNTVRLHRGTGGAAGSAMTERELNQGGPAAVVTGFSLPTTDVGTLTGDMQSGWNILQEFLYLPIPEDRIILAASDHFGVSLRVADTLTIGCSVIWEEMV